MTDLNEGPVGPPSPFRVPQQSSANEPFAEEQGPYPPSQQQGFYSPDPQPGYAPSPQQGSYSPPPAQYGAGTTGALPVEDKSPMISLICGIAAWLGLSLFTAIPAIIFGVKGRRAAREGRTRSGGMATAGLCLGITHMVIGPILLAFAVAIFLRSS
jgi:Domain of unknown function (DUF4190)